MKLPANHWLPGAIGTSTAIAIAALFGAAVVQPEPLGQSLGVVLGAGITVGLIAAGLRIVAARRAGERYAALRPWLVAIEPRVHRIVAAPAVADATASEFADAKRPVFAPVFSLTEAQVERARTERLRQQRRPAVTGA